MKSAKTEHDVDFAISFAGSERHLAERLGALLTERGAVVFIDSSFRSNLWGRRIDREFEWFFGPGTKYFVPIISQSYTDRQWAQYEWDVAIREEKKRAPQEFILPIRLDDTLIPGLPSTIGYVDLRKHEIDDVANLLFEKLRGAARTKVVYWVATFGLLIEDVIGSGNLPTTAPSYYPHLCDWLAEDLLTRLKDSSISNIRIVEDSRNGETFSVRIAFEWKTQEVPLDFGVLDWWEVLEVLPYHHVYQTD